MNMTEYGDRLGAALAAPPRFRFPADGDFGDDEYVLAPAIEAVAQELIGRCEELRHLGNAEVVYVWRRKGGKAKGKPRFGQCQKPTGLLAFFGRCDFVVAISADHCREAKLSTRQVEALVYHELKHAGWEIDEKTEEIRWTVVGHDWEGFRGEVERYGLWMPDVERMGEAFKQAGLFGEAA